ncbi:DNA (cytosine-5)-methyltransferase CMT2-like [Actinidia eriantha]|uniref:DNA (cytosine-5)-methyltransferase CMT2-like n=1 Tax=Actinidia eriantha TaxID=165200 RepID=UPI00258F4731|nr:DNA (cytosine-5)-methyltransferase CMT2-like [Actinidia eriantha]
MQRSSGAKCVRRSPRLTPSPAPKTPSKRRSPDKSNALDLSMHVNGDELKGNDPVLLKFHDPEKCFRRSPRYTTNMYRSKNNESHLDSFARSLKKVKPSSIGSNVVRMSPRFSSNSSDIGDINHGLKRNLLALTGSPPSIARTQCKKAKTDSGESDSTKPKENVEREFGTEELETKKAEEVKDGHGSGDFDVLVEKSLRSRKIPFRVVGDENGNTKLAEDRRPKQKTKTHAPSEEKENAEEITCIFVGEPVPEEEAREKWSWRYELKSEISKCQSWKLNAGEEDEVILNVECHYTQAIVDNCIFNLGDCACIKGDEGQKHVGKILEFFKTTDGEDYFRVQWFFRAEDTVMQNEAAFHDKNRLFYSTLMNDNLLDCIISKVNVIQIAPTLGLQPNSIPPSDFYYDMEYCVEYSTFRTLPTESYNLSIPNGIEGFRDMLTSTSLRDVPSFEPYKGDLALLDLYSGCGGMSTGLCLGAKLSSVNLVTRWAVDANRSACDSLKLNHPETQVRNETAEDFLELLKGWEKLCQSYVFSNNLDRTAESTVEDTSEVKSNVQSVTKIRAGEYEVLRLVDICYGDHCKRGKRGLEFKVHWKGYSSDEDTWEPIEGLSNCQERIQDFVRRGFKSKILPLPGDVDVLCGGPPCQGISGYNRFRNIDAPLSDERNHQIVVFMDIVKFLRPKYVLMENVVDILRFDKASLARYALSRLVHMKYQARLGTMAAGCYGLPQFRLRAFLLGALPSEKLPQFPRPTHDVVVKYWPPSEFERNTVAYDEGEHRELEEAIVLRDAISDLPAVPSHEIREQMAYEIPPETEFQKYIRLTKDEMMGFAKGVEDGKKPILYDHRPYQLSEDDYIRVCQIPQKKGANFRDLPGVVVGPDNIVLRDPTKEKMMLPSGKPMVPDYVFTFEQGKSKRPFARIWWDETVPTVVTFPSLHNQAALHPEQDRVLTIREYARLQGFPDFYRFCGSVKRRYCQVGNAVAVPVARALGYSLGMAFRKQGGTEPLMTLPPKFAFQQYPTDQILEL